MDTTEWLAYIGLGSVISVLVVNVLDAGARAYEKFALSTPEKDDDAQAAKIRNAVDAFREFVDAVVGLLRPFKK